MAADGNSTEAIDELEQLVGPEPAELTIGGETLSIPPIKVKQLPAFARAAQPLFERLGNGEHLDLKLLVSEIERVIEMVVVATGRERAWVDSLDLDQLIVLAEKIVEVNAAFFGQRTLPALNGAIRDLTVYLGALSSNASSSTGIGSRRSESTP